MAAAHAHVQRLRPQPRPRAPRTRLRQLILAQEDADVRLVALVLLRAQEGDHAPEGLPRVPSPLHEHAAGLGGEGLPRCRHVEPRRRREPPQPRPLAGVAGLGPGIQRPVLQRPRGIRDDQFGGVFEHGPEAGADAARAGGAVEAEQGGRRARERVAAAGAAVRFLERMTLGGVGAGRVGERDRGPPALGEGGGERVRDPFAVLRPPRHPVHDDEALRGRGQRFHRGAVLSRGRVEVDVRQVALDAVGEHAHVAPRPQVLDGALPGAALVRGEREGDREPDLRPEGEQRVRGRGHRIRPDGTVAARAHRRPGARPQQPQVVVDLRDRPHRRAARLHPVALVDGDGRTHPLDDIDGRLGHAVEELLRVGGERFDVPALPLGVDRVEGETRLPRAGGPREDREGSALDVDIDALEIVLPGTADPDPVAHVLMMADGGSERQPYGA